MGLFDFLKKAAGNDRPEPVDTQYVSGVACAPVSGDVVQLSETSDPVFSSGAMGRGVAVNPTGEVAYAPVSGTVSASMPHAVGITTEDGAEVLVHVGVDTVEMGGDGLTALVSAGSTVKAGDPVVSFSRAKISAAGKQDTVFVIVTNSDDYASLELAPNGPVAAGAVVIRMAK